MKSRGRVIFAVLGILAIAGVWLSCQRALAQTSRPPMVAEEVGRARTDFASGGARRVFTNWTACVDRARASQDANAAERCIVYGYGALLLDDFVASENRWPGARAIPPEIVTPAQIEMLEIMGIPPGPRQAWLDRYQRWVSEGGEAPGARPRPDDRPRDRPRDRGLGRDGDEVVTRGAPGDLARAADGQYPRDALRQPAIAAALRNLGGAALLGHLKDYTYGGPLEFNGQFTVGVACLPRQCGVAEARYVFSAEDAWIGIVDGRRMLLYGSPSRQARALLLRNRHQAAWRGAIEDMSRPVPAPVIPARVIPAQVIPTQAIPARVIPAPLVRVSVDTTRPAQPDADASEVRLQKRGGELMVPVSINNAMTFPFMIDSGASDVSISADVMEKLMRAGALSKSDFLGPRTYSLADGSEVSNETFRIHVLRVGDREVRDVVGSVSSNDHSLLLGQSFLSRFRSWSIDNQRQVLLLK